MLVFSFYQNDNSRISLLEGQKEKTKTQKYEKVKIIETEYIYDIIYKYS